jgi:hypothetical protein
MDVRAKRPARRNFRTVMPRRQRDTGTSHMPLQRQLRVGELVRFASAVLAATLVTLSPAFAEVCDKVVGEHWRPSDGPAWTIGPTLLWSLVSPIVGIFLLVVPAVFILGIFGGGRFLNAATKIKWLGYLGAIFFAVVGFLDLYDSMLPITDDILLAAIKEGCLALRTEPYALGLGATVSLALLYGGTAYCVARRQHSAKTAIAA